MSEEYTDFIDRVNRLEHEGRLYETNRTVEHRMYLPIRNADAG